MTYWKSHYRNGRPVIQPVNSRDAPGKTAPQTCNNAGPDIISDDKRTAKKHLTTTEAADYLRLSPRSLERYRVEGTGPRFLKAGPTKRARVLYRIADLDEWLEGTLFTSTSEYGDL